MKRLAGATFRILIFLSLLSIVPAQEVRLDVPYVSTPYEVIEEMLRMAEVKKGDILYDLGCGDGRIVIEAAQKFGARGVGIDIDPERIQESKENAAKAGVNKLVEFHQQDLFEADFHEASVVTLYLLSSINLKLRPKLLRELKPGSRVVSHDFSMENWKPDKSSEVYASGRSHSVYLWIIPANVSGTWELSLSDEKNPWKLELEQHFQEVSGTLTSGDKKISIDKVTLQGASLRFVVEREAKGNKEIMEFQGNAKGNSLEGTVIVRSGGNETKITWKSKRDPSTIKAIDTSTSSDWWQDFLK